MSKDRQRRRAEREAAAAVAAARREAEQRRAARQRARRDRWSGWLPRAGRGPSGLLADRKRKQLVATALLLVVLNLVVFALSREPGLSALLLVASLLGFPIVHMMIFRRT